MKIGIIADIHEDIVALKEALIQLEKAGCDELICLGDILGFKVNCYRYLDTRSAHECIAMVKANCNGVVIGNNDMFAIKRLPLPRFNGGFEFPDDWYELDFFKRRALGNDQVFLYEDVTLPPLITCADGTWLQSLPDFITRRYHGVTILFSHFAFPDLHGHKAYFPKMAEEFHPHLNFMTEQGATMGFSGHMHFEGVSVCNEQKICRNGFGTYRLNKDQVQWLYGPCIARGQFNTGVMILDTGEWRITSLPIHV